VADLHLLSAVELLDLYSRRELSPVEAAEAVIAHVDELNPALNAIVTPTPELALESARAAERAYRTDPARDGALLGVPFTVKDTIVTAGVRTTMGSLLFEDWTPDADAPTVERARSAGAALLGKTNTPELGWMCDTDNRLFGPTRNPWDPERSPGGSSGGAAAAVAAGFGPVALGTDAAGSTRLPAAFCGVYGLKPSFGLLPMAPGGTIESLGHVGILSRTVEDAALMLDVLAGPDARDRLSLPRLATGYREAARGDLDGLRVAWSPDLGYAPVEPAVAERAAAAAEAFESLGCRVEEVALGLEDPYEAVHVLLAAGGAGAHRDAFEDVRGRLDQDRLRVVEEGFRLSAADVGAATAQRARFADALRAALEPYDLLLTPTVAVTAFPAGARGPETVAGRVRPGLSWTGLPYPFNLTGQPAASVPCGLTGEGLPVGLQIVGRWRDDPLVLRASAAYERMRPWHHLRPPALRVSRRSTHQEGSVV
jgi:aspartyl-tRNA(Asn)/glutamyl-tRNA(Gln) amidotransferase subunit A